MHRSPGYPLQIPWYIRAVSGRELNAILAA
jgi:hypothetical protein